MESSFEPARDLIRYIDASPTPFHCVVETESRLREGGYVELDEAAAWSLAPGARAFVKRGESSLIAFEVGTGDPSVEGMRIVCAHTDSPNLRVKPNPDLAAAGTTQLAVEPYGGVLLHTWLDRDLGLAGRVVVREDGRMTTKLVDARRPLCRIPSLAIHLNRGVNTEGLLLNPQKHLPPLFALGTSPVKDFRALLATELEPAGVAIDSVVAWDLMLVDVQPSTLLGGSTELVSAPRLDNLASCHAATTALLGASEKLPATRVVALFDHEEVGSRSTRGAAGSFLRDVLLRVLGATGHGAPDSLPRAMARSFLVSADMAHALHPNHADKHEPGHAPILGAGPVVKSNVNQSYATDAETWARFEALAGGAGVPTQRFVTRSDIGCGSTVGPHVSAALSVRTVDVGLPMLSMHSCRELAASADVGAMITVLAQLFAA